MKFKLTKGRKKDLETVMYFMPTFMEKIPITEKDIKKYFEYSEQGKHKDKALNTSIKNGTNKWNGFDALCEGKRWRGIHMHELYEPGVLEGSMPYYVLLGGIDKEIMPRAVVDFMKREMFKGADAELIEQCYKTILEEHETGDKGGDKRG